MRKILALSLAIILVIITAFCQSGAFSLGLGGKLDRRLRHNDNDYYSYGGATNNDRQVLPKRGDIAS